MAFTFIIFGVIASVVVIAAAVVVVFITQNRARLRESERRHTERMAMINNGINPDGGTPHF